jgi:p-methyltransferase
VTESVWLPLYDLDFWSIPYLEGKGLSAAEVVGLLRTTQQIIGARDHDDDPAAVAELERRFAAEAAALTMAPPRFSY